MKKIEFWKNKETKTIDAKLYSDIAEELANELANEAKGKVNSRNQIRKFYDNVIELDAKAKSKEHEWEHIEPIVNMLIAKAAYAKGRGLISENFLKFIKESVNQTKDQDDLNIFANFFEAFMGFYRLHGPRT